MCQANPSHEPPGNTAQVSWVWDGLGVSGEDMSLLEVCHNLRIYSYHFGDPIFSRHACLKRGKKLNRRESSKGPTAQLHQPCYACGSKSARHTANIQTRPQDRKKCKEKNQNSVSKLEPLATVCTFSVHILGGFKIMVEFGILRLQKNSTTPEDTP